jgi:hypothetical protein
LTVNAQTITPISGALTTMYLGRHVDTSTMELFTWPDSNQWPTSATIRHSQYKFVKDGYSCPAPNGQNACGDMDDRFEGGWLSNGRIGFVFTETQGTDPIGTYTYPHIRETVVTPGGTSDRDFNIFNTQAALIVPAASTNGHRDIGMTYTLVSPSLQPTMTVTLRTYEDPFPSALTDIRFGGADGPPEGRWGDFATIRGYTDGRSFGTSFLAANYTMHRNGFPCLINCTYVAVIEAWFGQTTTGVDPFPVIGALSQTTGLAGGGMRMNITGSGFEPGVTVTFGGVRQTVTDVTWSQITITTAPHANGTVDAVVRNANGFGATARGAFTYVTYSTPSQRGSFASPPPGAPIPQPAPAPRTP